MAEQEEQEVKEEEADTEDQVEQPAGSSLKGKIMIAGFLVGVVLVECLSAYFLLPSADDVTASAKDRIRQDAQDAEPTEDETDPSEELKPVVEVDLGKFHITIYHPASNSTKRVDFDLFGTVLEDDEDEFNELNKKFLNRLREQVILTVRNSEDEALADPGLGLMKRKILEKSNRLLGKPLLQEVIFSEFSYLAT